MHTLTRLMRVMLHVWRKKRSLWYAGGSMGQQAEALAQPLDILVGTPQKLAQHAEKVRHTFLS